MPETGPRKPWIRTRRRMAAWERRDAEWRRQVQTIAIMERSIELLTAWKMLRGGRP